MNGLVTLRRRSETSWEGGEKSLGNSLNSTSPPQQAFEKCLDSFSRAFLPLTQVWPRRNVDHFGTREPLV